MPFGNNERLKPMNQIREKRSVRRGSAAQAGFRDRRWRRAGKPSETRSIPTPGRSPNNSAKVPHSPSIIIGQLAAVRIRLAVCDRTHRFPDLARGRQRKLCCSCRYGGHCGGAGRCGVAAVRIPIPSRRFGPAFGCCRASSAPGRLPLLERSHFLARSRSPMDAS